MSPMNEYLVALIALVFILLVAGTVFSLSVIRRLRSEETKNAVGSSFFGMGAQTMPIRTIAVPARLHRDLTTSVSRREYP